MPKSKQCVTNMKNSFFFSLILTIGINTSLYSQEQGNWNWVVFKDKDISTYVIENDFCDKAIERRSLQGISFDKKDYPIQEEYISKVSEFVDTLGVESRWLNMVAVYISNDQIANISNLSFVDQVIPVYKTEDVLTQTSLINGIKKPEKSILLQRQTQRMGGDQLQQKGLNGTGVRIAIFDAGFSGANYHPAFSHLRDSNRIIKTFDFVKNNEFVYKYHKHGTAVLSNIAGIWDSVPMGLATNAEFLLARTINNMQVEKSEMYWLAAIEWADRNGVQIVNSSLGFGGQKYFQEELDGHTSFISKAANIAAKKGILVINSAGNEGGGYWRTLVSPADADSVLTVGGINPDTDYHINFSSYGPTADNRMKPNVSNYAKTVVANSKGGIDFMYGTSFSCPLTVGFAACVWQKYPEYHSMDIFKLVEKSSHHYPYFDYSIGYGIPTAQKFLGETEIKDSTFIPTFTKKEDEISIEFNKSIFTEENRISYIAFIHIENQNGYLNKYWVIELRENEIIDLSEEDLGEDPKTIRIHINGTTTEYEL